MFRRRFFFSALLLLSVGLPYLVTEDKWLAAAREKLEPLLGGRAESGALQALELDIAAMERSLHGDSTGPTTGAPRSATPQLTGAPVQDLGEVLRFDVTPRWVANRWARVSTVVADLELEGLRVPLVTGGDMDDLAGSLTYYFDKQQRVRRITFQGYTGDERKLLALVRDQFGLRPEPTLAAGLYLARWNGHPTSVVRVIRAPVLRAASPHAQLEVSMELNRPDMNYGLSDRFRRMLENDRGALRW